MIPWKSRDFQASCDCQMAQKSLINNDVFFGWYKSFSLCESYCLIFLDSRIYILIFTPNRCCSYWSEDNIRKMTFIIGFTETLKSLLDQGQFIYTKQILKQLNRNEMSIRFFYLTIRILKWYKLIIFESYFNISQSYCSVFLGFKAFAIYF